MNRHMKYLTLVLLSFLLLVPLVSSVQNIQVNTNPTEGLVIEYPKFDTLPKDIPINLSIFTYNASNGLLMISPSCNVEIGDKQGNLLVDSSLIFNNDQYSLFINSGNFSQIGTYDFNIYCNTTNLGGFASGTFEVTQTGTSPSTTSQGITTLIPFLLMLFLTSIFFILGLQLPSTIAKTTFYTLTGIVSIVMVLYSLIVLNAFTSTSPTIIIAVETFYTVIKNLAWIGFIGILIILLFYLLRWWKIKRGLIDDA